MMNAGAAISGIAGFAYAQSSHQGHGNMPMGNMGGMDPAMQKMMQDMMPAPNDPPSTKDFKQVHRTMIRTCTSRSRAIRTSTSASTMIPHHQGAIDMAKVALQHAKDPETKKLARKAIDDRRRRSLKCGPG